MKTLVDILVQPKLLAKIPTKNQSLIVAEARYFNMLAQLNYLCEEQNIFPTLPKKLQTHLQSADFIYNNQCRIVNYEREILQSILTPLNINWIYLKGCAYQLKNIIDFRGRIMSDIDLLVAEKDLALVEQTLKKNGWVAKEICNYDEKFYREWAHEIPPLQHVLRQVVLDVHFNILPKTIKAAINAKVLFKEAIPLNSLSNEKVLSPAAMLMHSAIHLFYESEFHKGLRDLYDIAIFIKTYGNDHQFWQKLIKLHQDIGHQQSLLLALRYSKKIYQCEIPEYIIHYYQQYQPKPVALKILDFCFVTIFTQSYPPHQKRGFTIAKVILYLRGHLKRMPIALLIPHLTKKIFDKFKPKNASEPFASKAS